MALMKRCMGANTKRPKSVKCQDCARLVRTPEEEDRSKMWIENPAMPCNDYVEVKKNG